MFNIKNLQEAKQKLKSGRETTSESAFEEAWKSLRIFKQNHDLKALRDAANKLIESLKFNRSHSPSYFCLSYIFFVLDNYPFALKYFELGESYCEEIPEDILRFKNEFLLPALEGKSNYSKTDNELKEPIESLKDELQTSDITIDKVKSIQPPQKLKVKANNFTSTIKTSYNRTNSYTKYSRTNSINSEQSSINQPKNHSINSVPTIPSQKASQEKVMKRPDLRAKLNRSSKIWKAMEH